MKRCSKCGDEKKLEDFPRRENSPDGYRNHCKDCRRNYMREYEPGWRARNPDKTRRKFNAWRARNLAQQRERERRYDAANREKRRLAIAKSRAENPEHHRRLGRAWNNANPAKRRDIWYRWYAGTQDPSPATVTYLSMLLADPCCHCGEPTQDIDHITPRSLGGVHDWTNLTGSCASCNRSKGKRSLLLWLAGR